MQNPRSKHLVPLFLLISILFLAFWIRIQSAETLPDGQFLENDGYFYYWQANTIVEQGKLPPRDMHRWLPLGRDNGLLLSLYPHLLARTYKAVNLFFKDVSLYHVSLYLPTICFVIGLGVLCLFLYSTFGAFVANATGILIATLPGTIGRSTVGFGDRDCWCLLLAIVVIVTYLIALQTQTPRKRTAWTLMSGFFTLLGGLSWEGFGAFLLIIYAIEIWRFLTSERETDILYYLLWVCSFVPALYLIAPAYRRGEFFAAHLAAFVLVLPIAILAMRALRHLFLTIPQTAETLKSHSRKLALGLTVLMLGIGLVYFFTQLKNFGTTTILLNTPLMQTVSELQNPHFNFWMGRYGSGFIIANIALVAGAYYWKRLILALPLCLFALTTFARQPIDALFGELTTTVLFFVALATCVLGYLYTAFCQQKQTEKVQLAYIFLALWFFLWAALSRDAMRYDFFIGISVAFWTALGIKAFATAAGNFVNNTRAGTIAATTALVLILFWAPTGGHARFSLYASEQMRTAIPGQHSQINNTFHWIKTHVKGGVVAAHWRFGSQLNVLAGVKTITDQDHYIPNWIYLYNQHVHHAANEREALEYLKTHEATHILITPDDPHDSFLNKNPLGNRGFKPLFPKSYFDTSSIKLWEIHYPPDIEVDAKYLEIAVPKK
ncbi:MAG: hypothetical protein OXI43_23285 [Candidatus Poribacteria bacterium]|nr:hypothetical protein [Candidatus Poribacteria bacterium]